MKKRQIAALLSAGMLLTVPFLHAAAVSAVPQEITAMLDFLHGRGGKDAEDLNKDGVINAVDLTLCKRRLLKQEVPGEQVGEAVTAAYAATAENVKLIGRTLRKNDVTWLVQSGAAAEFTVCGTAASVTVAGDSGIGSEEKYRPRYGIYLDGELIADTVMSEKEQTVELFSGEKNRTAVVKVIHLSEANNGAVGVKQISVTSGSKQPIAPTAKKKLRIEFIGDSITCAYGVEAESQYVGFSTATENFTKSYAYLTAELLDADYSAVCYSGYGIISGYSNDGEANTGCLLPDCYTLVGNPRDYRTEWDFTENPQDVVVINLGTNDDSYCSKDLETRGEAYREGYTAFLKTVREKNPEAQIICTLGIMGCEELYPYLAQAVADLGDDKILCYQSPTHTQANGMGADWHPSPLTHTQNAYILADKICTALGLPWSKIGLDMAADGEYGADIDKEAGANAAIYFSDWDKSLWVNTVTGGDSPESITAYVRGLSLPAGDYELSFRTTPPAGLTVAYQVRSSTDHSKIYCTGEMEDNGEEQVIKKAFSMTAADESCEIVFFLGGKDSATVTLHDVTLFKTK